ncbi:PREDICTED: uncharacterized protein LOC108568251 [Nicrophorus vespilloides]|uniref:Uncharacterized protein LOC108568251 n=1 Tax=Nicrophorus vespilloides TaxID=110193 RepID=A0ABM1ND14_NICVS|nr:PREDICTED: uncharacterized protein LOC108568251 [Nicrophorus vespilloides]
MHQPNTSKVGTYLLSPDITSGTNPVQDAPLQPVAGIPGRTHKGATRICARITADLDKYLCVVSSLDEKNIREVEDVIGNPPAVGKYENLKNTFIERQLPNREEMDDRAPSKYLRHLRELAETTVPEDFIKTLWMERHRDKSKYVLVAANYSTIATIGTVPLVLHLELRQYFTWNFVVADVSKPIIGADFLDQYKLLVDISNKRLDDQPHYLKRSTGLSKLRRLVPDKLRRAKAEFVGGPVPHGANFRYPVPHIEDFAHPLRGKTVFTKLDHESVLQKKISQKRPLQHPLAFSNSRSLRSDYEMKLIPSSDSWTSVSSIDTKSLPKKVEGIRRFPQPTTAQYLRKFLGIIIFYRRFLANAAGTRAPLNDLLVGNIKEKSLIKWSVQTQRAFESCKESLTQAAPSATNLQTGAALSFISDASDFSAGAALQQRIGNEWKPLGFFSKKLTTAEKKYSAYDRELLAIYLAVKHFRHLVEISL